MDIQTKQDRSVYYWLVDLFSDAPFINIVDEYTGGDLTPPTVAVKTGVMNGVPFELGNKLTKDYKIWFIDIYAKNVTQRNDFAYRVYNAINQGIPVYDYDEGFPPDVAPTQLGALNLVEKKHTPIEVIPELPEKMYWRGQVTLFLEYSPY